MSPLVDDPPLLQAYAGGVAGSLVGVLGFFAFYVRGRMVFTVPWWRLAFMFLAFAFAWPLSVPALFLMGKRDG